MAHDETWNTFDGTWQTSTQWLDAVADALDHDRQRAYHALRGVLHTLRDRLPTPEVTDLGAQLPMIVRGLYYDGYTARNATQRYRSREEFLLRVADAMRIGPNRSMGIDPRAACTAVFSVLQRRVSRGEIQDVVAALPTEIRELWPVHTPA